MPFDGFIFSDRPKSIRLAEVKKNKKKCAFLEERVAPVHRNKIRNKNSDLCRFGILAIRLSDFYQLDRLPFPFAYVFLCVNQFIDLYTQIHKGASSVHVCSFQQCRCFSLMAAFNLNNLVQSSAGNFN